MAALGQLLGQEAADLQFRGLILELAIERRRQRIEAVTNIGLQANGDVVVQVDFGRKPVNMDDLLVAPGIDPNRVELLELVADRDDDVGLVETEVHVVVPHEPDRTQGLRMVVGEHAFAVERRRHRDSEGLGEVHQGGSGAGPGCAVAGQDDRIRRRLEYGGGTGHLAPGTVRRAEER